MNKNVNIAVVGLGQIGGYLLAELYKKKNDQFKDKFTFITPGYCVRPLEIEAAAGLIQIKKLVT